MEMADLMLVKPGAAKAASFSPSPGSSVGLAIQVQFVKSDTPPLTIEHESGESRAYTPHKE
jgi:hypothetical protein